MIEMVRLLFDLVERRQVAEQILRAVRRLLVLGGELDELIVQVADAG